MPISDITINWGTKVITIPKTATDLVQTSPSEIRQMDLNAFRGQLNDLQDDPEGIVFDTTHTHNKSVAIGGVELARVIEMINDYTVTFEDGQYAVNLIGANSNVADRVNVNQVSVRSANSAGLVTSAAIEFGEYGGGVTIDATALTSGTVYPFGTARQPVNNLADASLILESRGFSKVFVVGSLTLDSGDFSKGVIWFGQSSVVSVITIEAGINLDNCEIHDAYVQGILDNGNLLRECLLGDITSYDGYMDRCGLNGTVVLGGTSQTTLVDCFSNVPGALTPTIDVGTDSALAIRGYSGGMKLIGKTGTDATSIDIDSGQIIIDSTCVAGVIYLRGTAELTNNSSSGCHVIDKLVSGAIIRANHYLVESQNPTTSSFGQVYFLDPIDGNDTYSGTVPTDAFKTFTVAHDACVSNRGDIIHIISPTSSDVMLNEAITVSKNQISIRSDGHGTTIQPTAIGAPAVTVTGQNVSFLNLTIKNTVGASDDCVYINNANHCTFKHVRIENSAGRGIHILSSDKVRVLDTFVGYSASHGIEIHDCHDVYITMAQIDDNGGDNLRLTATASGDTHEVIVRNTIIHEAGGYGVNIGAGCEITQFLDGCKFISNTSGAILDNGITTFNEADTISTSHADAVWDEAIADHIIVGSTGASLNDVSAGASPSAIADAVWDEPLAGHVAVGSAGKQLGVLQETGLDATYQQMMIDIKALVSATINANVVSMGGETVTNIASQTLTTAEKAILASLDSDIDMALSTLDTGLKQVLTNLGDEIDINEATVISANKRISVTI